jgi:hypothetical protein
MEAGTYYARHREKVLAYQRAYAQTEKGKAINRAAQRKKWLHRKETCPEKLTARSRVSSAVRDGRLIKRPCVTCGAIKVEAHHPDYSRPLEVIWLCSQHHRELGSQRN